jgi:hypothetical protein
VQKNCWPDIQKYQSLKGRTQGMEINFEDTLCERHRTEQRQVEIERSTQPTDRSSSVGHFGGSQACHGRIRPWFAKQQHSRQNV